MNQQVRAYNIVLEQPKKKGIKCLVSLHKQFLVHKEVQDGVQRDNAFGSKDIDISREVNEGKI
jgi:hypothetical protein